MNNVYASRKYRSGFSLIEILVAVLILSVGLLGIAGLQSQLMGSGVGSRENSIAEALAKQKMEEFKQDGFESLPAIPSGSTSVTQADSANPFNSVDLFYSTGNSNNRESNDFSADFNRSWVVSPGPTANSRLVKVIVSWVNKSGQTKNFSIYSYITLFNLTGFANQTAPAGSSSNPIQTITQWKPGGNYYKKDVIVSYKEPNGTIKYYMSNSSHTDNYALTDPGTSSDWALVNFIQGNLTWTPNSTSTHTVCELRFADEITAFGTKPNGSIDPSATNPNATSRRCSPNMLSGQGILSTNFACALKAGESKSVYAQCEIEDGSGGTTIMGPIGPYTTAQTGVNLNLCQSSGSCISSTPAPTSVPTATPVTTATPIPTVTPVVTATPVPSATPVATIAPTLAPGATATPKPPATLQITLNMANNNKKDGTTCTLQILTTGTVCAASSWSTIAVNSGGGSGERNYSTTCTLTGSSANINLQCGNTSTNSYSSWLPLTLTPGNTTTQVFNNF